MSEMFQVPARPLFAVRSRTKRTRRKISRESKAQHRTAFVPPLRCEPARRRRGCGGGRRGGWHARSTSVLTCALSRASLGKAVIGPSGSLASSCSALDTWPLAACACGPASLPAFRARQRSPPPSSVRCARARLILARARTGYAGAAPILFQALRRVSQCEATAGCPAPSPETHSANFLEITPPRSPQGTQICGWTRRATSFWTSATKEEEKSCQNENGSVTCRHVCTCVSATGRCAASRNGQRNRGYPHEH